MRSQGEDLLGKGLGEIRAYGIVGTDPHGLVTSWNEGAVRLTGIPAADALHKYLRDLLAVEPETLAPDYLSDAARRGGERGLWIRRRGGSSFWGAVAVAAVQDEEGTDPGFVLLFRDATALKLARQELERSRSMFEGILSIATDGVVCADETQRIVFFNEGAERIFGYTADEALGKPLEILVPERFAPAHARDVEAFARSHVAARQMGERGEISGRRKNGEVFPAEASISKLHIGESGMIFTAVLRDVTDRRAAEQALARQAKELARSNADLEQFAYVASHDLQEPLRMVASYTQLLARRYRDKLDADADEFIGFAVDGVTRMQSLINDLLAYSRAGTRGGEPARVSLESVLARVLSTLGPALEEAGATVTHDPLPPVLGDAGQLSQLLQNLIHNAMKFRRPDQPPEIHVGAEDDGEMWHIHVRDNGIGIAPEFGDRIFVIFQRLHNRSEYPGTGIGLSICKKIVERHGGSIRVESEPGVGSTFHFTLPKPPQDEAK